MHARPGRSVALAPSGLIRISPPGAARSLAGFAAVAQEIDNGAKRHHADHPMGEPES